MLKCQLTIILIFLFSLNSFSQVKKDTIPVTAGEMLEMDTSINYDELLNELDLFLDSLLRPRSFFLASLSVGNSYTNYWRRNFTQLEPIRKFFYTPVAGFYHKSGAGMTVTGNITDDERSLNLFQFSVSPSYDFIRKTDWIGGVAYTRYFTKDSLPFYTSPLQNEYNVYFLWRRSWLQPGLTVTYGHGSRSEFNERKKYIEALRKKRGRLVNVTETEEKVADFSITATVRHSFYKREIFNRRDYIKFAPQLAFSAGSQQFGFNRTTTFSAPNVRSAALSYSVNDISVNDGLKFQPLSTTLYIRPEYSMGIFFIQPQLILDYYFPTETLAAFFSVNAGVVF